MDDEPIGDLTADLPSTMRLGGGHAEARALDRALDQLDDRERRVIVLRHREDQSFEEIARRLDLGPAEARALWFRALDALSELVIPPHDGRRPDSS